MSNWKETTLGNISSLIQYGYTESASIDEIGPKFLRITDIQKGIINWNDVPYCKITDIDFNKYSLLKGDICVARTGNSTGENAIIKKDIKAVFASYLIRFQINEIVAFPFFISYLLRSYQWKYFIKGIKSGSAQAGANAKMLSLYSFSLPPLAEQKSIAAILSSLDNKIENLRQQNQTLEKIAQTLFKHWFVDFEFPNEQGKLYKSSSGKMIDSELGPIPYGWRVENLSSICKKISKGTTPTQNDINGLERNIPFLKVKDLDDNGDINLDSIERIPRTVHETKLKRSILQINDILFSIAGTIGRVAIIPNSLDDCNINQALAFIRLISVNTFLEYTYLWLRSPKTLNEINSNIVQAVQSNVSLGVLSSLLLIIPSNQILLIWCKIIKPIFNKIDCNKNQIQTLTKTSDTLLPKLMSGEIRVPTEAL